MTDALEQQAVAPEIAVRCTHVVPTTNQAPVYFPGAGQALYGVLTRPGEETGGTCFVSMHGGGYTIPSHNNRITYQLAQSVGRLGFSHFRFVYRGVANSTGRMEVVRFDEPYLPDVEGATDHLRSLGYERFVLMGSCFGSRTALSYAGDTEDVAGVVLVAPSPRDLARNEASATKLAAELSGRDYLKRAAAVVSPKDLVDPERLRFYAKVIKVKARSVFKKLAGRLRGKEADPFDWVSPNFLRPLEKLAARGVPVLLLYGTSDWFGAEFQKAKGGRIGRLLDESGGLVQVMVLEGNVQGLSSVATQRRVTDAVLDWLQANVSPSRV